MKSWAVALHLKTARTFIFTQNTAQWQDQAHKMVMSINNSDVLLCEIKILHRPYRWSINDELVL
jgi:hypothetical protein